MASKADIRLAIASDTAGMPPPDASAEEHRKRPDPSLAPQRLSLDRLESKLGERLQQIVNEVAREIAVDRNESSSAAVGGTADATAISQRIELFEQQLALRHEEADHLRSQLQQARTATAKIKQKLRIHETLLAESHEQQEKKRVELAIANDQFADAQAQLMAARKRLDLLREELENQREKTFNEQQEMKAQRRRIARELKAKRAARSVDHEASETEMSRLRAQLKEVLAERDRMAEERSQIPVKAGSRNSAREDQLQAEVQSLTVKLAAAENRLANVSETGDGDTRKLDELEQRLENAVEALRAMNQANFELEAKLRQARESGSTASGTGLDWESQKRRLLASLEADDSNDEKAVEERTSIEATVRITDQIVATKDREIAELHRQWKEHKYSLGNNNLRGNVPKHDFAPNGDLDRDEAISQERKKLQQMQAECHEKISKAEIEISVERAKIARDRAELEEKLRSFQRNESDRAPNDGPGEGSKPMRGRWLARLGLKDLDEHTS